MYKFKEIDEATLKFVVRDGGYDPIETDTPEFNTNLQILHHVIDSLHLFLIKRDFSTCFAMASCS
jgi:hypothetical protein